MSYTPGYSFGGRLFVAILLALLLGFGWACWEAGRSPLDILKLFGSKETPPPTPPPPAPKKDPVKAEPVAPKKDPSKTDPVAVAPAVVPAPAPAKKSYSSAELNSLFTSIDDLVRAGRFFEAGEKLRTVDQQMLPAEAAGRFADTRSRLEKYSALMQETTRGLMIEMPKMHEILIAGGSGKPLIVKVLAEDTRTVSYETILGIRSSLERSRIEQMNPLQPPYAEVEIKNEHKRQAQARGLEVIDEYGGKPLVYREKPGAKVTGQQFFDLADFCARNGANKFLAALFDEALKRDPDLLTTVHENKAERMVNVFLYFLSINSPGDANNALGLLEKKYADTRAYREKVVTDKEVQDAIALILRKPPAAAIAAVPKSAPPVTPTPADPAPAPAPDPLAQTPKPAPKPVEIERQPDAPRPTDPTTAVLEGAPPKVAELIAKGDRHFEEAMKHLRASDPDINPNGWSDENKKALESFMKANQDGYYPAQDQYGKGAVPQPLLDRVRETTMRSSLCRKRSVSTRK